MSLVLILPKSRGEKDSITFAQKMNALTK